MMYVIEYAVQGNGTFPFDMLRYDSSFPFEQIHNVDVELHSYSVPRTVVLRRFAESKFWEPTNDRWRSFGWGIVPGTVRVVS